jgi:penicillin-binding protein 1C
VNLWHRARRASFVALAGVAVLLAWIRLGSLPDGLLELSTADSTVVLDRNGNPLYEALGASGLRGEMLTAGTLPPALVRATLAAEDHRFYHHPGVDVVALARAARRNLAEGRVVEGGSTITQQVVKLLLARRAQVSGTPSAPRRVGGKLYETVLALRLEHRLSKEELLALYFNVAPYGNRIAGAQRASRAYFGVGVSMLTPAQAAFLAALPQQPSRFNPWQHPDRAVRRGRRVIERMRALELIDARAADEALAERLALRAETSPFAAPHFVERVLEGMWTRRAGGTRLQPRPLPTAPRIHTTLDGALQADAAGIIRSQRRSLDRHGAHAVAVAVLDNVRGEWLAWEGSGDYFDAEHGGTIDGVVSPRQPGSALKPFTYALAFDAGYEPSSVLADVPSHFPTAEAGVVYSPRNYDGRYRGPMRARAALAGSENVPAVALLSELGPPSLVRFLRRAGFTTFDKTVSHYGLGITLGNAEVRLDELVAAYASLARGGLFVAPTGVAGASRSGDARPLVSERAAFWTTDILSDDAAREFAFGRGSHLEFPFPVAAKTGTSQGYRDNWAVGYTREVTVGVWVGNFDRTPLRNSSGVTGAGPIFHQMMLAAARRYGSADALSTSPGSTPAHTARDTVCTLSGMRANEWCPSRTFEWVAVERGRLPCSWHHMTDEGPLVVWPTQYRAWAAERGLLGFGARGLGHGVPNRSIARAASVLAQAPSPKPQAPALQIVSPPDGATYLIDPTLRREFQTLPLQAASARDGTIEWHVDGKLTGRSAAHDPLSWPLTPGRHVISARDARGRTAEATIVVK